MGSASTGDDTLLTITVSDENLSNLFGAAKRVLGGEVAVAYWKTRVAQDPGAKDLGRLEAVAFATMPEVREELEVVAAARVAALFAAHGTAIEELPAGKRQVYERILGQAGIPARRPVVDLPDVAHFRPGAEDWPRHLYSRDDGMASLDFNKWETELLREELKDPAIVAWLRNPPRKDWSLCVPYPDGTTQRPMYPDFLFVRDDGSKLVVDIVDPHDPTADDAADKARGLAEYAQLHGHLLGRIDLVAKVDGKLRRLHLKDESTRKQVAQVKLPAALPPLYRAE